MLDSILPNQISNALKNIPYGSLCELRLRAENPVVVNILGENFYLCSDKLSKSSSNSLTVTISNIYSILNRISNNSIYTINDQLINGYVTIDGGIRVGVCGEVVSINNEIKTIKNISSINFRFPHLIKNCSLKILSYITNNSSIHSTLIISPPGAGKTTYLRDLIFQLTMKFELLNILVIDERQEISSVFDGNKIIKLNNIDVYSNSSKKFGFNNGIRSMKPDVIFTDEINLERDVVDIENALTSGVKVIATMHADNVQDLRYKPEFKSILEKGLFTRFVVLSCADGVGTLEGVFNENLNLIGI